MTQLKIGTGGWAYFNIPARDRLRAYSQVFNHVEVNSTFYAYPPLETISSWRRRAPTLEFAVRCHRDLTHRYLLEPRPESRRVLNRMITTCRLLKAETLHMQTPPTLELTHSRLNAVDGLLDSVNREGIQLTWEIRSPVKPDRVEGVRELMKNHGITHCIDISKNETPLVESKLLYTRLFGPGPQNIYQYTDEELTRIHRVSLESGFKKAVLSFHGTRMYKDAYRLRVFDLKGEFPMVTNSTGLDSLREVLAEDAKLPATREELIKRQGWKVVDITDRQRVRASRLLEQLPEGAYSSVQQVIEVLDRTEAIKHLSTS